MILYFILGAVALLYLVFSRKKPAAVAAPSAPDVAPVRAPKVFSTAAQGLKERLKLADSNRPVTISIKNVEVLSQTTYKEDLPTLVRAFEELAHVYIIVQTNSDEEDHLVRQRVVELLPEFPIQRCLVYSLEVGKTAIVRQVIPSVHIEHDRAFCEKMKPHVRKIIWVDGGSASVSVSAGLDVLDAENAQNANKTRGGGHSSNNSAVGPQGDSTDSASVSIGFATVTSLAEILSLRLG